MRALQDVAAFRDEFGVRGAVARRDEFGINLAVALTLFTIY